MKRSLFCMLFITLFNNVNIIASEDDLNNKSMPSWHYNYFAIKEFYNLITSPALFKNPKKMNDAKIACCKCNQLTSSSKLWAYFMAYIQEPLLQELMFIVNNGSIQELVLFNLQKHQEFKIRCDHCFTYSGYYIPEQESLQS